MRLFVPDLYAVEQYSARRKDFFDAYRSVASKTVMLAALLIGVASHQFWHIHWIDIVMNCLAWFYAGLIILITLIFLTMVVALPLLQRKLGSIIQISRGRFSVLSLINAFIYPAIFYFAGHLMIALIMGCASLFMMLSVMCMAKLVPKFMTDYDPAAPTG